MATKRTITQTLTAYHAGKIDRMAMLKAMREFAWQPLPVHATLRPDAAWENDPYPPPGTTEEVMRAYARRLITLDERNEILDIARTSGT